MDWLLVLVFVLGRELVFVGASKSGNRFAGGRKGGMSIGRLILRA